jgi:hypothetical protein
LFDIVRNRHLFERTMLKFGNSALERQGPMNVPTNVRDRKWPRGATPSSAHDTAGDSFKIEQLLAGLTADGQQGLGRTGEPTVVSEVNAPLLRLQEVFVDSN